MGVITSRKKIVPVTSLGALFEAVQMGGVFADSKTFVDCVPKYSYKTIASRYARAKDAVGFDLKAFVGKHFVVPRANESGYESDLTKSASEHISGLWDVLTRQADGESKGTLISLPYPYIVPGGRFGEIYYWDSYFTMLGLQVSGRIDLIQHMVDNFSYLIDLLGYIPNGNRSYFMGRSQPPFYSLMVRVLGEGGSTKDEGRGVRDEG